MTKKPNHKLVSITIYCGILNKTVTINNEHLVFIDSNGADPYFPTVLEVYAHCECGKRHIIKLNE